MRVDLTTTTGRQAGRQAGERKAAETPVRISLRATTYTHRISLRSAFGFGFILETTRLCRRVDVPYRIPPLPANRPAAWLTPSPPHPHPLSHSVDDLNRTAGLVRRHLDQFATAVSLAQFHLYTPVPASTHSRRRRHPDHLLSCRDERPLTAACISPLVLPHPAPRVGIASPTLSRPRRHPLYLLVQNPRHLAASRRSRAHPWIPTPFWTGQSRGEWQWTVRRDWRQQDTWKVCGSSSQWDYYQGQQLFRRRAQRAKGER